EVNLEPDAHLARLAGSGEVALAYRELATDGGYQLRVARNLFDGGVAELWAEGVQESAWISFQGSSRGLQLAWKAQTLCPECPESGGVASYRGRVFARSESSAVVELTPGAGALQFDGWSRPGVALTPGPEGWMTFFVPVLGDAGVDLRAVRYCAP
ncbi:MAG TPA: hypothetical protein VFO83_08725, partial [Aggregicoccus sp.]|nr:hypothetical protein [Aggregicoccus sp.]